MRTGILTGLLMWVIVFVLAGCSFKVEAGWHGETGVDNRTQSQLVKKEK